MNAKFVLETVNSAFGVSDDIPWHEAHRKKFPTLGKAQAAFDRDCAEMNERCGLSAWDSHRRIVPVQDTTVTYILRCTGWTDWTGQGTSHWCDKSATIVLPWPAGESAPRPETIERWESIIQCSACAEQEEAHIVVE